MATISTGSLLGHPYYTASTNEERYLQLEQEKQLALRQVNSYTQVKQLEEMQKALLGSSNSNFSKYDIQRKMTKLQKATYTDQHQNKGNSMVDFKKGKMISTPIPGTLMFATRYTSSESGNIGFLIHTPDNMYNYKVNKCDFDRVTQLEVAREAVIKYDDKEFTVQAFSIDSDNNSVQLGEGSSNTIRAVLYYKKEPIVVGETTVKDSNDLIRRTNDIIAHVLRRYDEKAKEDKLKKIKEMSQEEYTEKGKTVVPELVELQEAEIELNVEGSSVQEKFISIVGKVSELTQNINANTALGDNQDIVESFIKAKEEIGKLASTTPNKVTGFFGKYFKDNKTVQKMLKTTQDIRTENDSIQNNINHLFGIIHSKYEKLIVTGESLQKTKALLVAQVEALEELKTESDSELAHYKSQADVPMNDLRINTQIKASVEKYRQRLVKIDSAIMATQTTIIALGKELPAMKTDLIDEMAIGSLLSNVDDYQHMFQEIAELVSGVAKTTSEQTHTVIENLMDMQINDNHTMQYLAAQSERGEKFVSMVTEKSQLLAKKVNRDATFIEEIGKGTAIEHVRAKVKMLDNKS